MDEAITDLLKKYDRPSTLKAALRKSVGRSADIVQLIPNGKKKEEALRRNAGRVLDVAESLDSFASALPTT